MEGFLGHTDNVTIEAFKQYVRKSDEMFHGLDVEKVSQFYLKNTTTESDRRWAAYDFYGDLLIKCPTYLFGQQMARNVKSGRNVYFYELTYEGPLITKVMGCDEKSMGICHEQDLPFVFGWPTFMPTLFTPQDILLTGQVIKMWTNFAKLGYFVIVFV